MQAWALQQVLKRMGHDPETIALCHARRLGLPLLVRRCLSVLKCLCKRYLLGQKGVYIYSIFSPTYNPKMPRYADAEFVRRICLTKRLRIDGNLAKYVGKRGYDAFVVGSDQVWREEYSPLITHYFLDFLQKGDKRPKIAYAASFGKSNDYISADNMPRCRELLARFNAVSVREGEGIEILERDFDFHDGIKVLDPTLLLHIEDYKRLICDADRKAEPHIAAYVLDKSREKDIMLEEIGISLNLPSTSFSIDGNGESMLSISQWLAQFESADYVFTDSFHGCVFSILFHKPFIAVGNRDRGLDRFVSLLRDLNLEERLVMSLDDFSARKEELMTCPDYSMVEHRLAVLRSGSLNFLSAALNHSNDD